MQAFLRSNPLSFLILSMVLEGCVTHPYRPCSGGGQPAHDASASFQGIKRCYQVKDDTGKFVNDGKYMEWYPSEKISIVGEYKSGKKTGRWIHYDENGNKVNDTYFQNGKEISSP